MSPPSDQSTGEPSAMASTIRIRRGFSSAGTAHFRRQSRDRPGDGHPRGIGTVLSELGSHFLVIEPKLDAQHDGLALWFLQGGERMFVVFKRFGADSRLQRRRAGRDDLL